ncbi:MAG: cell division protein FtsW (lipid II flippase), partial [Arcticibacterium sp.]
GGTSILFTSIALGIVLSVSRNQVDTSATNKPR